MEASVRPDLKRPAFGAILGALLIAAAPLASQDVERPKILLDQSVRAVEYQLGRLTDDQLLLVERKPDDVKYRPIYIALLTRKSTSRDVRDEALAVVTKLDRSSPPQVLIEALGKVPADDAVAAGKVLAMLFGQPAAALRQQRDMLVATIEKASEPFVLRGAYGATLIADGSADAAWQTAAKHDGHLVHLLRGVADLPAAAVEPLKADLAGRIAALVSESPDAGVRAGAIAALASIRRDAATFTLLSQQVIAPPAGSGADVRAAAIRGLQMIPENVWPAAAIEPLARAVVALIRQAAPDQRTEPAIVDAVQLAERLTAALPADTRITIRRELRGLSVQIVRIQTLPERMEYDLNWFAAEAGKPVQIVLFNPDAMPHNIIVGKPGSLRDIGTAATGMPMPSDPDTKPFVPDSPLVLAATKLVTEGETAHLSFTAPAAPGEYVFLCTFPGHWVRMYGVMLVVENLEAWEAKPTTPLDPVTNQPFASQRK
jgi:uncharacterized cupredoxin-like copper-binding protein